MIFWGHQELKVLHLSIRLTLFIRLVELLSCVYMVGKEAPEDFRAADIPLFWSMDTFHSHPRQSWASQDAHRECWWEQWFYPVVSCASGLVVILR